MTDADTTTGTVTTKGALDPAAGTPHHVLDHAHLPVMTVRESALANNTAVMQAYVDRHGLLFAPHMKTHMAPDLAARQIDAGAWGVTVASVQQAMVAWEHGVHRILVANEVLDPAGLAWLASRRTVDPDADVLCYVDSAAGVTAAVAAQGTVAGELHVLVELGFPGGRTGVRSPTTRVPSRCSPTTPGSCSAVSPATRAGCPASTLPASTSPACSTSPRTSAGSSTVAGSSAWAAAPGSTPSSTRWRTAPTTSTCCCGRVRT
ncbi:type III PLP-dependent enzyme domain-containing protein [Curtobacterium sp. 24E2]|nr:alanine racemase [Curtobacterium sp. 24E2]